MSETVLDRRQVLAGAGGLAALAGLWQAPAVLAAPRGAGASLTLDVACLGGTFSPTLGSFLANPAAGDLRGIAFSVEGAIYPDGTIPMGAGFDPASATAIGTWVCRGWLILWPGRPAPNAITTQEYYLGVLAPDNPSPEHQLVSSGTEGGVPSTARSVLGGTGRYRGARGEVVQDVIGTNTTILNVVNEPAPNFRFQFRFQ